MGRNFLRIRLSRGCLALCSTLPFMLAAHEARAQCAENNYIHDGAPSSQRDCQPLAAMTHLAPDAMSSADQQLVELRHADLAQAARFHGFDIESSGWTYQQAVSPILQKHVLLIFTHTTPLAKPSRFTAILPSASDEKVQVVPAFSHGLHPFIPGAEASGSYAVFNRLLTSEQGEQSISAHSDWIGEAVLYLTLVGHEPSVPTESDSIQANWDLGVKRATTPVILLMKSGAATIAFSDLSDPAQTTQWKLMFNKQGLIVKADRSERTPVKVRYMQTADESGHPLDATH